MILIRACVYQRIRKSFLFWIGALLICSAYVLWPVASLAGSANGDKQKLVIGVSEWAPYNGFDLPGHGLLTEIVQVALSRAGYDVVAEKTPWTRVIKGTSRGEIDIIPGIWYKKERADTMAYGPELAKARLVLISHRENSRNVEKLQDLDKLRIGLVKDYAYPKFFLEADNYTKDIAPNLATNLSKLARGRIDAALGDEIVARHTTRQLFEGMIQFRYSKKPLETKGIFLAVSKVNPDHREIIVKFEKALTEMKADGTYEAILQKHDIYGLDEAS